MSSYFLLFSFTQSQREDELDISQEEVLEVLEWDNGDGWCKGWNKLGKEGFFPQSYVQPSSSSSSLPTSTPITTTAHTTTQHQENSSVEVTNSVTLSAANSTVGKEITVKL